MDTKVFFITGTSRGFGRIWAEAALERGYRVVAATRNAVALDDLMRKYPDTLLPLTLDVTDREACFKVVRRGWEYFGRIDVAINVAGFSLYGAIEEMTEPEARIQLETNLMGPLWITQAVLPVMRNQRSGHIIQVSSVGGLVSFPTLGLYHASKWGLEGFTEALAQEVEGMNIRVTLIEPGIYNTSPGDSPPVQQNIITAYDDVRKALYNNFRSPKGDPNATVEAIFSVIGSANPPLRLFLGTFPYPLITKRYEERIQTWEEWKPISDAAQGN